MPISNGRVSLTPHINFTDKVCKRCQDYNIFTQKDKKKICKNCDNIELKLKDDLLNSIDQQMNELYDSCLSSVKTYNKSKLLSNIYPRINPFENHRIKLKMIWLFSQYLIFIIKNGDSQSKLKGWIENFTKFDDHYELNEWKKIVMYDNGYEDKNGNRYLSYKYMRRVDGFREFNITSSKDANDEYEKIKDEYDKELKRNLAKSESSDDFFEQNKDFVYGLYAAMIQDSEKLSLLNFSWMDGINIDFNKLRDWRLKFFDKNHPSRSGKKTRESLITEFGTVLGTKLFENLFVSNRNSDNFPYGINNEGIYLLNHQWVYFIELLIRYKNVRDIANTLQQLETDNFEKQIVPQYLQNSGIDCISGNKDKSGRFEIDTYGYDKTNKVLWVIESKGKGLSSRFMESYDSWDKTVKDFIDRPKNQYNYPQIVELIKENLKDYQETKIINENWEIEIVKGMLVTRLPPFVEKYKSIDIIWYKEIEIFFKYSN